MSLNSSKIYNTRNYTPFKSEVLFKLNECRLQLMIFNWCKIGRVQKKFGHTKTWNSYVIFSLQIETEYLVQIFECEFIKNLNPL